MLEYLIELGNFPIKVSAGGLEVKIYEENQAHGTMHYPFTVDYNGRIRRSKAFKQIDLYPLVMNLIVRMVEDELDD